MRGSRHTAVGIEALGKPGAERMESLSPNEPDRTGLEGTRRAADALVDSGMLLRRLLLTQGGFDNEIFIPVSPEAVLARLSRPQDWIRLQPLVVAIDEDPRAPGMLRLTDRFEVGGRAFHVRYRAQVIPVSGGLDGHAWSFPFIHVVNRLRCHAQDGGTLLRETSTIEAPRPLLGYARKTAQAAHATMLANLRDALVNRGGAR